MSIQKKSILTYQQTDETVYAPMKPFIKRPSLKSSKRRPKKAPYKLLHEGVDVTPKPLNPMMFEGAQEKQLGVVDISNIGQVPQTDSTITGSKFATQLHQQALMQRSERQTSFISTVHSSMSEIIDSEETGEELQAGSEMIVDHASDDIAPPVIPKLPTHVNLVLNETPTYFIFEIRSSTCEKETNEGEAALKDNEVYDFLTVGRGRNRRLIHAECQTLPVLFKTRDTQATRPRRKNMSSYAAIWDMYDSFAAQAAKDENDLSNKYADEKEENDLSMSPEERQMIDFLNNEKFREALLIIERLLANNNYNRQQKRFRGLIDPDPFRDDIQFNYQLELLWTFANIQTADRCVTAIEWNPINEDILAVGYGKFYFHTQCTGLVLIWNIKNPVQPERSYSFEAPVTSLQFSNERCNEIAVGLFDGNFEVIDISIRNKFVIGKSRRQETHSYEPIWQVLWFKDDDYLKGEDQLITAGEDGRINRFRRTNTVLMSCQQIMRVARPEGKTKGIEIVRRCSVSRVPVARYSAALVIARHPADPNIYFVGTNYGIVHKCSTDYYHQHLDMFLAHDGAMYEMKFSPFCDKLFLTCGDDWCVRIWCEGITEPLLELSKSMLSVESAAWSTIHSTVIASITGTDIFIWDIQRKAYKPQSITPSPTNCRNTVVSFSPSGRCVLIGDIEGNVHVFSMEEMPFEAFFPEDLLTQALKRAMITKPYLIKKLKQIGRLKYEQAHFQRHFR